MNLNGFDVEEAKILRLSGQPQNAPEGMIRDLCELNQRGRSGQGNSNTEAVCGQRINQLISETYTHWSLLS